MRTFLLIGLCFLLQPAYSQAQGLGTQEPKTSVPSHETVLAQLASTCLAPAVEGVTDFRFIAQGRAPFLASALSRMWIDENKNVHLSESPPQSAESDVSSLPLLAWTIDRATIHLERAGRKSVERTSDIALTWWLSESTGRLLNTKTCSLSSSDEMTRREAEALADVRFSETNPDLPPAARWRRIVEPVVLTGATAVGTYLLFNLRSRRADN